MTASMLRRPEPVVSFVPRFTRRVQSKRAAAPTSWPRRFARKSVDAVIDSSRSASRVIAAGRIARRRAARPRAVPRFGRRHLPNPFDAHKILGPRCVIGMTQQAGLIEHRSGKSATPMTEIANRYRFRSDTGDTDVAVILEVRNDYVSN